MGRFTSILMLFKEVTDKLDLTNELLAKIEQHLKSLTLPPDMIYWANIRRKDFPEVKKKRKRKSKKS